MEGGKIQRPNFRLSPTNPQPIPTTGKNAVHPFDAISMALAGQPWLPPKPADKAALDEQIAA